MHMKMVHDRKIYLCDQCPRELSTKVSLRSLLNGLLETYDSVIFGNV